jgi:hypothetical protein
MIIITHMGGTSVAGKKDEKTINLFGERKNGISVCFFC